MLSLSEGAKLYPGIFRVSEDGEETAIVQIRAPPIRANKGKVNLQAFVTLLFSSPL